MNILQFLRYYDKLLRPQKDFSSFMPSSENQGGRGTFLETHIPHGKYCIVKVRFRLMHDHTFKLGYKMTFYNI